MKAHGTLIWMVDLMFKWTEDLTVYAFAKFARKGGEDVDHFLLLSLEKRHWLVSGRKR